MTIDDNSSIYVGGLAHNCSEDIIRKSFELYGTVVAVKLISARDSRGKCYGFVTFTNPRSATIAISEMDGRTIDGQVVRVSEVRTRGGRPIFNRDNTDRDSERDLNWNRGRVRERDHGRYRDRHNERSRDREQEAENERPRDRSSDRILDRDRGRDREHNEKERSRNHDRDSGKENDLDWEQDTEVDKTDGYDKRDEDKGQHSKSRTGTRFVDRRSRDLSSNSSDEYEEQVKELLGIAIQKRDELQKEISEIEGKIEEKQHHVSDLQKKSEKLEGRLDTWKQLSSQQQKKLTKLQRCYSQVKDYTEKLKSSQLELESLVDISSDEKVLMDGMDPYSFTDIYDCL
ncbi:hypothetical protein GIB67_030645 [Kingdonia uniflora]|uniref:RRM domain-containing protein n=1 Tax=Kingdonia uniflora TaxID=39325 RepID=A0A7J7NIZ9_9MAGN|nr:hypothetical protein GIB67_030645 [Kingdonia uniflora]